MKQSEPVPLKFCLEEMLKNFKARKFGVADVKPSCAECNDTGMVYKTSNAVAPCTKCEGKQPTQVKPKTEIKTTANRIF